LNSPWSLGDDKSLFAFCRATRNVRASKVVWQTEI